MSSTHPTSDPGAFAHAAVRDSLARMQSANVDTPELLDESLIIPANIDAAPIFARMRILILAMFIAGLCLLPIGITLFFTMSGSSQSNSTLPGPNPNDPLGELHLVLAGLCTLGGIALLVLMPFALKSHVNKAVAQQHAQWTELLPDATYFNVNIEDAATYDKLKILADDYGIAWFDPLAGRLLIEGLRYRYFILREHVAAARLVKAGGSQGVELTIHLSPTCELKMTLICEQVRQELKKQIAFPGKSVLVKMIEDTFEVEVGKG